MYRINLKPMFHTIPMQKFSKKQNRMFLIAVALEASAETSSALTIMNVTPLVQSHLLADSWRWARSVKYLTSAELENS